MDDYYMSGTQRQELGSDQCHDLTYVNVANFLAQTEDYKGHTIKYMLDTERTCDKYQFLHKTRLQAIIFVDLFLRKNSRVEQCTLKLIGIAAILVAVKINEDRLLSIDQCVKECNGDYSHEMIIKTERILLVLLDFRMNISTAIDFVQFFLYLSDPKFDFSDIVNESLSFIYISIMDSNLCRFKQSSIAVASILLALHFKGVQWVEFSQQWFNFIDQSFNSLIDQREIRVCQDMLCSILFEQEKKEGKDSENIDLIDQSTNSDIVINNSSSSKSPYQSTLPESNVTTPYSMEYQKYSNSNYVSPLQPISMKNSSHQAAMTQSNFKLKVYSNAAQKVEVYDDHIATLENEEEEDLHKLVQKSDTKFGTIHAQQQQMQNLKIRGSNLSQAFTQVHSTSNKNIDESSRQYFDSIQQRGGGTLLDFEEGNSASYSSNIHQSQNYVTNPNMQYFNPTNNGQTTYNTLNYNLTQDHCSSNDPFQVCQKSGTTTTKHRQRKLTQNLQDGSSCASNRPSKLKGISKTKSKHQIQKMYQCSSSGLESDESPIPNQFQRLHCKFSEQHHTRNQTKFKAHTDDQWLFNMSEQLKNHSSQDAVMGGGQGASDFSQSNVTMNEEDNQFC